MAKTVHDQIVRFRCSRGLRVHPTWAAAILLFGVRSILAADPFDVSLLDGPAFGFDWVIPVEDVAKFHPSMAGRRGWLVMGAEVGGTAAHSAPVPWLSMIVAVNGWRTSTVEELRAALQPLKAGDELSVAFRPAEFVGKSWLYEENLKVVKVKIPSLKMALLARLVESTDRVTGITWVDRPLFDYDRLQPEREAISAAHKAALEAAAKAPNDAAKLQALLRANTLGDKRSELSNVQMASLILARDSDPEKMTGYAPPIWPYLRTTDGRTWEMRAAFELRQEKLRVPQKISIRAGKLTVLTVERSEVKTEESELGIKSSVSRTVDEELLSTMAAVAAMVGAARGQGPIVRFEADADSFDRDVGNDSMSAIGDVLLALKLKGGRISDVHLSWYADQLKLRIAERDEAAKKVTLVKWDAPQPASAPPKKGNEETAASKLKLAKSLLEKNEAAGRKRLQEIIDQFSDTPSAEDARKLLKNKR